MTSPAIRVIDLTKRFGERVAFEKLFFVVGAGEVFGFLGPNGAGKTTTVRVLATLLERPWDGRKWRRCPSLRTTAQRFGAASA